MPPSYIRVHAVVWAYGRGQTDRQTQRRTWPQYILRRLRLTKNVTSGQSNLHKAASPPHMDGTIVFARLRQCAPHLIMVSLVHLKQNSKWHRDLFSCFSRDHGRDRQTDRQIDHATLSLTIGRSYIVLRCGLMIIITSTPMPTLMVHSLCNKCRLAVKCIFT